MHRASLSCCFGAGTQVCVGRHAHRAVHDAPTDVHHNRTQTVSFADFLLLNFVLVLEFTVGPAKAQALLRSKAPTVASAAAATADSAATLIRERL